MGKEITKAERRQQKRRQKMRVHGQGMKKLAARLSEKHPRQHR